MKFKTTILSCIGLILIVGAIFLYKNISSEKTPLEIISVKETEIDSIILQNGKNGHELEIKDNEKLKEVIDILQGSKYKYESTIKEKTEGFTLSVKFFSNDAQIAIIVFKGSEIFSFDYNIYSKVSGELGEDEMLKLIELNNTSN